MPGLKPHGLNGLRGDYLQGSVLGYSQPGLSKLAFWTLPWSIAVYPTQAKKRLEWGTQLLLAVQGGWV